MKLKNGIVTNSIDGESFAIATGEATKEVLSKTILLLLLFLNFSKLSKRRTVLLKL